MSEPVTRFVVGKREGGKLEEQEIRDLISGFMDGSVADYQMSALAMAVYFQGMDFDETVAMTLAMRDSGEVLSLDDKGTDGVQSNMDRLATNTPSPLEEFQKKELKHVLAEALKTLSKREQMVMSLYYYDELTLREIAEILGVTESRVSQIHSKVIIHLHSKLKRYYES